MLHDARCLHPPVPLRPGVSTRQLDSLVVEGLHIQIEMRDAALSNALPAAERKSFDQAQRRKLVDAHHALDRLEAAAASQRQITIANAPDKQLERQVCTWCVNAPDIAQVAAAVFSTPVHTAPSAIDVESLDGEGSADAILWPKRLLLRCAVSMERLIDPAKGESCSHPANCNFDALATAVRRISHAKECPVAGCRATIRLVRHIVRDDALRCELSSKVPANAEAVWVDSESKVSSIDGDACGAEPSAKRQRCIDLVASISQEPGLPVDEARQRYWAGQTAHVKRET